MKKLLIANRGEIACRIARTARRLGLAVATVHSSADRSALHVREIGESIEIGPAPASASYLDIVAVVRAVESAGLVFVGPDAATIERLGGKASAKREAARLGIPVVDGSSAGLVEVAAVAVEVRRMGLPVLLKAVAGGGGRGMALIERDDDLEARIEKAMREAEQGFGSGELIVERYLPHVRHVEVQIAGDGSGDAIHLYERECTLQRRHQKIIEEAPAPALAEPLRDALRADACRLAAAARYRGLGTVEFIVADGKHHFLEVNPRLQVEHAVTEAVTGLDLVELQLRIADSGRLPLTQRDVVCTGHAFEARLCAEEPAAGFRPATGRIACVRFPAPPIRVEAGVADGDLVTPHYDSMIAKLIAHGESRDAARLALIGGLAATRVLGVETNLAFVQQLLGLEETRDATFHTRLVDERQQAAAAGRAVAVKDPDRQGDANVDAGDGDGEPPFDALCAAALFWLRQRRGPGAPFDLGCWTDPAGFTGWRLADAATRAPSPAPSLRLRRAGRDRSVRFGPIGPDGSMPVAIDGRIERARLEPPLGSFPADPARHLLHLAGRSVGLLLAAGVDGDTGTETVAVGGAFGSASFDALPFVDGEGAAVTSGGALVAPMMGSVVAIRAQPGDRVARGQTVIVLESMKMELHVGAPFDAALQSVRCAIGEMVARGALLAEVGEPDVPE